MTRIGWMVFVSILFLITEVALFYFDTSGLNKLGAFLSWLLIIFNLVFGE